MPYIGNTVQNQGFAPAIDYFSGNGVTVTFTLSRPVASVAQIICAIDNVIQNPSSAYTVSGSSITFTSAPLSGTNNIWVEYTSLITTYAAISQSPSVIGDITASGGYLAVGSFGNSFIDGTIVDYTTGNGRVTVGPADGLTLYTGGTSARTNLASWDSSGNLTNAGNVLTTGSVGVGTTSPASKLNIQASSLNYATFSVSGTNKAFFGVDNGSPELVVGASAGDAVIRTQQQLWFGLNGGGVAGRFDSSGVFYMNSGYGSAAAAYGVRVWINYNGITNTIRASGGVSSLTYRSTGNWDVNFSTAMPDANYSSVGTRSYRGVTNFEGNTTTYARVYCAEVDTPYLYNPEFVYVAIIR
jgi:hypothetical protein